MYLIKKKYLFNLKMIIINSWFGRLGNNIIQLKNALHIALELNHNVKIPKHHIFNVNEIIIDKEPKKQEIITDNNNFFYLNKINIDKINIDKNIFTLNNEKIKKIIQSILNSNIDLSRKEDYNDKLIIHIRSGDIFNTNPHCKYIPPPYNYYKNIIENTNYKNIEIISEDTKNPVINKLLKSYNNITYKKRSLIEDINIILNSKLVVSSIGSFIPSILFLSDNIEKIYNINYDYEIFYKLVNNKFNCITYNYTDYKNKINLWNNNKEQIDLLINYTLPDI
jgi:hypothetical protein